MLSYPASSPQFVVMSGLVPAMRTVDFSDDADNCSAPEATIYSKTEATAVHLRPVSMGPAGRQLRVRAIRRKSDHRAQRVGHGPIEHPDKTLDGRLTLRAF